MEQLNGPDPVYLDYNATTPTDPRVASEMMPYLTGIYGNPSSSHALGQAARRAIESARGELAQLLAAEPGDIVFTSGGTEANTHAICGAIAAAGRVDAHIVTTAVEHPAVTEVCRHLASRGVSTTYVAPDRLGRVDPDAVEDAFTANTVLVSVMHANNEVGTIQPVAEIARRARARGILSHSDCAQSVGKIPVTLGLLEVDMLSVAGHKLYAPKGVGALCLRSGLELPNLMFGAGHESGRRPGTENILEIVGLGTAARLAGSELARETDHLAVLRDRLQHMLMTAFPAATVNGHPIERLPNTLSIGIPGIEAAQVLSQLKDVAVSAGAACHGGGTSISHVLQAMRVPEAVARGTLRISVGRMTTDDEIEFGGSALVAAVNTVGGS